MDSKKTSGAGGTAPGAQAASVGEAAQTVATKAKDAVEGLATSQFSNFTSQTKDRATGALGGVVEALRATHEQLRQGDQDMIAGYVDKARVQLERVASQLESKDLREIVRDVEGYARREPAIFLGGAFVLGLLGARFLKSSARSTGSGASYGSASHGSGSRQSYPVAPTPSEWARGPVQGAGETTGVMYGGAERPVTPALSTTPATTRSRATAAGPGTFGDNKGHA